VASQTAPRKPTSISAQTIPVHPRLIMQTPSTAQIRTAIQGLKKYGEHINHNADNVVIELPETRLGGHVAARAKVLKIEQTTRIQSVAAQLEKWRDQLLQQRSQCVSHHV
jgi:hypothetical protein